MPAFTTINTDIYTNDATAPTRIRISLHRYLIGIHGNYDLFRRRANCRLYWRFLDGQGYFPIYSIPINPGWKNFVVTLLPERITFFWGNDDFCQPFDTSGANCS